MTRSHKVNHALSVMAAVERLRSSGSLCDFELQVGSEIFNTHRLILSANSGYFKSLFASEDHQTYLKMEGLEASVMQQCVEYMYTSSCTLQIDSVDEILEAANFLQMSQLEDRCFRFLQNHLSPENSLMVLGLAKSFHNSEVEKAAEDLVKNNFESIILSEYFPKISKRHLLRLVSDARPEVRWKAITTWSNGKDTEFCELVKSMDYSQFSFDFLLEEVLEEPRVVRFQKVKTAILRALLSDLPRLEEKLNGKNCFILHSLAIGHSKSIIVSFMKKNFPSIICEPGFCSLSKQEIMSLITSREVKPEEAKWTAILKWVKFDLSGRQSYFPFLFRTLVLGEISWSYVEEHIRSENLVEKNPSCMRLLMDAAVKRANSVLQNEHEGESGVIEVIFEPQPSGGEMQNDSLFQMLDVTLPGGSHNGVEYLEFTCSFHVPDGTIRTRLVNAFRAKKLFELRHDAGSTRGNIVIGDIPLDPNYHPWFGPSDPVYLKKLDEGLNKKGF